MTAARLETALDALRSRRARAAEYAEQLSSEIDRVDGTPTATALRERLAGVVGLIDRLDEMLARGSPK